MTEADLVLKNGAIYTVDAARSWASAVAVAAGKVVYVGWDREASNYIGKKTKIIDLDGKMVLPGLHDSHCHPVWGGMALANCNLNDCSSKEEVLETIANYASSHKERHWIVGQGWGLPLFPGANPNKEDLDRLVPNRPVYLESQDCHSAWVNSYALAAAQITRQTSDPERGHIERDPDTGEPSGVLRELAMGLVKKHIPKPSLVEYTSGLCRAQSLATSFGITSIQDAMVDEDIFAAYLELERQGKLTLKVVGSLYVDPEKTNDQVNELIAKRDSAQGARFRAGTVKIFADGVIEAHTAALLKPYIDKPCEHGVLNFAPERLKPLMAALDKNEFQIHIHAIGDQAIRSALDAHEYAQKANGKRDARHHIAHLQLIDPKDISRFQQLGVIANFQPYWAHTDRYISEYTIPAIGPQRAKQLYPIADMIKTGAVMASGSDWPVSTMNPFEAIEVAITRRPIHGKDGGPLLPEQSCNLHSLIAAYTINGAYLNRQEKITGSIELGKAADLIVLDANLFAIAPEQIHKTKVLLTLIDGNAVYDKIDSQLSTPAMIGSSH